MQEEIKKCLTCAMSANHRFRDCADADCECNCLNEIHGETPLPFDEWPDWFRLVSRKDAERFNKIHLKKGS